LFSGGGGGGGRGGGNMELSYCIEKNSSYLRSCCSSGQGQR
jgi:hypothetical protein